MSQTILQLAEEALEVLRMASKGQRASITDELEPGIRRGKEWETLKDKAEKALELLDDLHQRKNYTVAVELALYAIERMTEAAVIKKYVVASKRDHGRIFDEAADLGILDKDLSAYLSRMFRYRSDMYYRMGIGTKALSEKLNKLSKALWKVL